jgi:hypothetical protein
MKKLLAAAAAVALTGVAAPAFAQTVDGSIGWSTIEAQGADLSQITGRVNWGFNDIFGIEGEASFGIDDATVTVANPAPPPATITGTVEVKHQLGVFGTAGFPLGENGRVFGRVGYATTKFEGVIAGLGAADVTDEGFAYGVGVQFLFDGVNGIRGDYTNYDFDDLGTDADVWSISYVRRFR